MLDAGCWMLDVKSHRISILPGRREGGKKATSWKSAYRFTVLPAN
jgi:hypothetical protein